MLAHTLPSINLEVKNMTSVLISSHIFEKDIFKTKIQFSPNSLY
jgi:hypothetical protein